MEDGDDLNLTDDESQVRKRINKQTKREKPCRPRFDVLATPHKRAILGTYQDHSHHFPKEKVQRIKHKLQELFAMTPEETEMYFEQMRKEANEIARQKMMKYTLKKIYNKQEREKQERKAYRFVEKLLKLGMNHSFNNPVPPLLSVRLRNLSDLILEQICDLRNLDIPDKESPDRVGLFLMGFADWTAIAIEHVYYAVQLKKNAELLEIEKEVKEKAEKEKKGDKEKKPASRKDRDKKIDNEEEMDEYGAEQDLLEVDME